MTGKVRGKPLGTYLYWKRGEAHFDLVEVAVYRLDVTRQLTDWRERGERTTKWMSLSEATEAVQETGLQDILTALHARLTRAA